MNKKGNFGVILVLTMTILFFSFIFMGAGILNGVINYAADQILPEIGGIGQVGNTNFTEIDNNILTPVDNVLGIFNTVLGMGYAMSLIMVMGLAVSLRFNGSKWLVSVFLIFAILVVGVTIYISNTYEELYQGSGAVAESLQAQPILSWLMLYSPMISTIVFFICGIIIFTGREEPI